MRLTLDAQTRAAEKNSAKTFQLLQIHRNAGFTVAMHPSKCTAAVAFDAQTRAAEYDSAKTLQPLQIHRNPGITVAMLP